MSTSTSPAKLQLEAIREAAISAREQAQKTRRQSYLQSRFAQWRAEEAALHRKIAEKRQLESAEWQSRLREGRLRAAAQAAKEAQREAAIAAKVGDWRTRITAFISAIKAQKDERQEQVEAAIAGARLRTKSAEDERRGARVRRRSAETELEVRRAEVADKRNNERHKRETARVKDLKKNSTSRFT